MSSKCTAIYTSKRRLCRRKQSGVARASMERHTECFICISIFVILLPNFARPEECTKTFTSSTGNISELFHAGEALSACRYLVHAPNNHYILLNITRLIGFALDGVQNYCLPRLVIISTSAASKTKKPAGFRTICGHSEPLPIVVQSDARDLSLIFNGSSSKSSGFSATYTFHRKKEPDPPPPCLSCRVRKDTIIEKTVNNSSNPSPATDDRFENPLFGLEIFFLAIITPVTIICMCCIIVYFYHRKSTCFADSPEMSGHSPRTPSPSDITTIASPLLSVTSAFSAQQNQDMLREQREVVFRRSESTEKFPVSIHLRDEDEPIHLRGSRLNPDIGSDSNMSREGVRGPPNRTVYDMLIPTSPRGRSPKVKPVRTMHSRDSLNENRCRQDILDSITQSPVNIPDGCEAPPPYSSVVVPVANPTNNNLVNVCDIDVGGGNRVSREYGDGRLERGRGVVRSGSTPLPLHSTSKEKRQTQTSSGLSQGDRGNSGPISSSQQRQQSVGRGGSHHYCN